MFPPAPAPAAERSQPGMAPLGLSVITVVGVIVNVEQKDNATGIDYIGIIIGKGDHNVFPYTVPCKII